MRQLVDLLVERRPPEGPYLIGITGAVAVGKSTMSATLSTELSTRLGATCSVLGSDAFLWSNEVLEDRGLTMRKGFPESYDTVALRASVAELAEGRGVEVPSYSHRTYNIEPGRTQRIEPVGLIIVEGLHLTRFVGEDLHVSVHLDAPAAVVEEWYVARLATLVSAARSDRDSFYRLFVDLDARGVETVARDFWSTINLVNLREHIDPWRDRADIIVTLNDEHQIVALQKRAD